LELGARDIENGVVTYARRDIGEKGTIPLDSLKAGIDDIFGKITEYLSEKAWRFQNESVTELTSVADIPKDTEDAKLRIYRFGWCGSSECGHRFEDDNDIKILGTPYLHEDYKGRCIICGKDTDTPAYAARTM